MSQQVVPTNGVELCVETFGDAGDPAILLIGGAGSSMDWWDDEFCERLAAGLRFVIRYDTRDTGRSTSYEAGAPQYDFADLAADALSLLDVLTAGTAHVVGISMGGMLSGSVKPRLFDVFHSFRMNLTTLDTERMFYV